MRIYLLCQKYRFNFILFLKNSRDSKKANLIISNENAKVKK